jgi:putative Mg2+ transporter-C (MgtC) family protein
MTTAANIWIAAAVGIACGAGQYALVAVGAGLALLLLTVVRLFERFALGKSGDEVGQDSDEKD